MTPPEDYKRLAENLHRNYGRSIVDGESFNKAYDLYLASLDDGHPLKGRGKKAEVFRLYRFKFPLVGGYVAERKRERQTMIIKEPSRRAEFIFTGVTKDKVVLARSDTYSYKGKTFSIFRDRKGRFVSVKG